jgi:predicted nuclease of restriction endonuclease-like (RecB) superfamily
LTVVPEKLLTSLSYSHLELLPVLADDQKRAFYEIECIRGNWSVRELKRQINSLYYERSGLSKDKAKLAALAQKGAETTEPKLAIRDPYIFEFLGLRPKEVMSESHLEEELLDKLQDFLLEMGYGFCFEARQKRILIGDTHNFVDLVFYHRILLRYRKADPDAFEPDKNDGISLFEKALECLRKAFEYFSNTGHGGDALRIRRIIEGFRRNLHYEEGEDVPTLVAPLAGDIR